MMARGHVRERTVRRSEVWRNGGYPMARPYGSAERRVSVAAVVSPRRTGVLSSTRLSSVCGREKPKDRHIE